MRTMVLSSLVIVALGLVVGWIGLEKKPVTPYSSFLQVEGYDHRRLSENKIKGQVIVLNFWASWCPPCLKEMPSLLRLVEKHKTSVQFIGVSADDSEKQMRDFLSLFPMAKTENAFFVFDGQKKLMTEFNIEKLPETLIFDRKFKKAAQFSGATDFSNPDVIRKIEAIISTKTD